MKGVRGTDERFRHPAAVTVAAVIAFLAGTPMLVLGWYAVPILLVPLVVAAWSWRVGTDADVHGLRVRALLASRTVAWTEVAELAADPRGRAVARLTSGSVLPLPAVRVTDLPRLVRAAGQTVRTRADPAAGS